MSQVGEVLRRWLRHDGCPTTVANASSPKERLSIASRLDAISRRLNSSVSSAPAERLN